MIKSDLSQKCKGGSTSQINKCQKSHQWNEEQEPYDDLNICRESI